MPQPEGNRILAAFGREFVEKGLDREHVALRAECPQRGGSYRHGGKAMGFDLPRWKIVERNRIAVGAAATRLRRIGGDGAREWFCEFCCREQGRPVRAPWPRRVTIAPDAVAPVHDLALCIKVGLDLDR